jgi:hypothetical protein
MSYAYWQFPVVSIKENTNLLFYVFQFGRGIHIGNFRDAMHHIDARVSAIILLRHLSEKGKIVRHEQTNTSIFTAHSVKGEKLPWKYLQRWYLMLHLPGVTFEAKSFFWESVDNIKVSKYILRQILQTLFFQAWPLEAI